jgi:hypothetical protein
MIENNDLATQLRDVFKKLIADKELTQATVSLNEFVENGVEKAGLVSHRTMADALKDAIVEAGFSEKYVDFRITHRVFLNAEGKGGVEALVDPEVYEYTAGRKTENDTPSWGDVEDRSQYLSGAPQMSVNDDPEEVLKAQINFENERNKGNSR